MRAFAASLTVPSPEAEDDAARPPDADAGPSDENEAPSNEAPSPPAGTASLDDSLEHPPSSGPPPSAAVVAARSPSNRATPRAPSRITRSALIRFSRRCAAPLAAQLASSRGDVVGAACRCVAALARAAVQDPAELADVVASDASRVFAPALLRVQSRGAGDPSNADRAHLAFVSCVDAVGADVSGTTRAGLALAAQLEAAMGRRSSDARLRTRVAEYAARMLGDWPRRALEAGEPRTGGAARGGGGKAISTEATPSGSVAGTLARVLVAGFGDEAVATRVAAKAAFDVFEATWPRRAAALVARLGSAERDLVAGGSLRARPPAGVRGALGSARAGTAFPGSKPRETPETPEYMPEMPRPIREGDEAESDAAPSSPSRRLTLAHPDARTGGAGIAASAPVAWSSEADASDATSRSPPPAPLWEDAKFDPLAARAASEARRALESAHKKSLASYYDAVRARGFANHPPPPRAEHWGRIRRGEPPGGEHGRRRANGARAKFPSVFERDEASAEEARLREDLAALDRRLIENASEFSRARATERYVSVLETARLDDEERENAAGEARGGRGRAGVERAKADKGWVRDPETERYVPLDEYVARWAPPPARVVGAGGMGGALDEARGAGSCAPRHEGGDAPRDGREETFLTRGDGEAANPSGPPPEKPEKKPEKPKKPRDAEDREKALRRIRAEWNDEALDVRDGGAAGTAAGASLDRSVEGVRDGGVETRAAREARLKAASAAARLLREKRAKAAAKDAADEKLYREMTARQEARLAEAKARREDDERAMEVFRLRAENDALRGKLDRLFYERLVAPGEVKRDPGMSPAMAARLVDEDARRTSPRRDERFDGRGSEDGGPARRARTFRGGEVRGSGGVDVDAPATPDPVAFAYPGGFEREIAARRADIAERTARKRAMGLGASRGRWDALGEEDDA